MSEPQEKCTSWWYSGRMSGPCRRDAVEGGLCKAHLAGKRRSEANDAKRAEERRAARAREDARDAQAKRLAEALGIDVLANWAPSGYMAVSPAALEALAARLSESQQGDGQ